MVLCWSYLGPVLRPQTERRTAAGGEDGLLVFPGETVRPRLLGLTLRHHLAQSYKLPAHSDIFGDIQFKIVFQPYWRLSLKQILHIIFVVCVDDKSESFLQSFFPVDFILELIEIHLVANFFSK